MECGFTQSIELPQGALLGDGQTVFYCVGHNLSWLQAELWGKRHDEPWAMEWLGETAGGQSSPSGMVFYSAVGDSVAIDNSQYGYLLRVFTELPGGNQMAFYGCAVGYTADRVAP